MSEFCFHVQIHINYLQNISGGVAAATCFDLIVQPFTIGQEEVSLHRKSLSCVITCVFQGRDGTKGDRGLAGASGPSGPSGAPGVPGGIGPPGQVLLSETHFKYIMIWSVSVLSLLNYCHCLSGGVCQRSCSLTDPRPTGAPRNPCEYT